MVMTFIFHLLSHYNSITESRAQFLLSLLEGLFIDFSSHFILSLIDVYRDMATRDKFIFPSVITQILRHFSVSYPKSTHFSPMCAIDAATVKQSEAQLRPKRPRTETVTPLASSAPSSSALTLVASWHLPLLLQRHLRTRTMMVTPTMMMMRMRMRMLALSVTTR